MFLIDTVVLSALRKRARNPGLVAWMSGQRGTDLYLSVVSIGEIERGIARQSRVDPEFARTLSEWLDRLLQIHAERILPLDLGAARHWGRLSAALGHDGADLLIAATARQHGLTVVTRNTRHFEPAGVPVINPFS